MAAARNVLAAAVAVAFVSALLVGAAYSAVTTAGSYFNDVASEKQEAVIHVNGNHDQAQIAIDFPSFNEIGGSDEVAFFADPTRTYENLKGTVEGYVGTESSASTAYSPYTSDELNAVEGLEYSAVSAEDGSGYLVKFVMKSTSTGLVADGRNAELYLSSTDEVDSFLTAVVAALSSEATTELTATKVAASALAGGVTLSKWTLEADKSTTFFTYVKGDGESESKATATVAFFEDPTRTYENLETAVNDGYVGEESSASTAYSAYSFSCDGVDSYVVSADEGSDYKLVRFVMKSTSTGLVADGLDGEFYLLQSEVDSFLTAVAKALSPEKTTESTAAQAAASALAGGVTLSNVTLKADGSAAVLTYTAKETTFTVENMVLSLSAKDDKETFRAWINFDNSLNWLMVSSVTLTVYEKTTGGAVDGDTKVLKTCTFGKSASQTGICTEEITDLESGSYGFTLTFTFSVEGLAGLSNDEENKISHYEGGCIVFAFDDGDPLGGDSR